MKQAIAVSFALLAAAPGLLSAQLDPALTEPYSAADCQACGGWNAPQEPFRLHGNSYWVGSHGLGVILITTPDGHILIDGGLPDTAPLVVENVRQLGFDIRDVRIIVNSHAHFDHAGGISALQKASGARVMSSVASASALASGLAGPDDPQFDIALPYPPSEGVEVLPLDQTIRLGDVILKGHLTPGHTAGGMSWSWESCEAGDCWAFVYADSLTPVSDDAFRFGDGDRYPSAVADFQRSYDILSAIRCDVLITPHPDASGMWDRMAPDGPGLVNATLCERYASSARDQLQTRLDREAAQR